MPLEDTLEEIKLEEWDRPKVLEIFEELRFNRYIERFGLKEEAQPNQTNAKNRKEIEIIETTEIPEIDEKLYYYLECKENNDVSLIIKEEITGISIYDQNKIYYIKRSENFTKQIKKIFENDKIEKYGYDISRDYILLKQIGITMKNMKYDAKIATYILNPTSKYTIDILARDYLEIDNQEYLKEKGVKEESQTSLFEEQADQENNEKIKNSLYVQEIYELSELTLRKLEEVNAIELFDNIDMPTVEVLAEMQWNGMYVDINELEEYGNEIKGRLEILTQEIHELCGEEFNINSTKQLGEVLFEKLKLPVVKKTKSGYSTDMDVLEKLKEEHPVIERLLEYRQLMKLNSTYVEGMKQYINPKTHRIHSFFHQTITATGRISSTEPNLQNIPTRFELGKRLRKIFKPSEGCLYIDADYSQIELRVLAHISKDKHMVQAFKNGEDIHKQAASKVFNIPLEEVTKEQRSSAKAVNFGIVYGISDFGLGEQLGISRKEAKKYIEQYLEEYSGIKKFMDKIVEKAKKEGYVETLFKRRRYIPELKSNNYIVRQFGQRVAMNTPIQGTAADIMKIAMINVLKELKTRNMKSKIILQVHDEVIIEATIDELNEVADILKNCMEKAVKLSVPLIVDVSEASNWYDCK